MDDLESRLGALMNDPDMMQKIMSFAQSLNQTEPAPQEPPRNSLPDIDLTLLQKLSGLAGKSSIDSNQRNLLQALGPYINHSRISRLERAMRAARMAGIATTLLPQPTQSR